MFQIFQWGREIPEWVLEILNNEDFEDYYLGYYPISGNLQISRSEDGEYVILEPHDEVFKLTRLPIKEYNNILVAEDKLAPAIEIILSLNEWNYPFQRFTEDEEIAPILREAWYKLIERLEAMGDPIKK